MQQVDLAQELMKDLLQCHLTHSPTFSETLFQKLRFYSTNNFKSKGHLILIGINLLVHYLNLQEFFHPQCQKFVRKKIYQLINACVFSCFFTTFKSIFIFIIMSLFLFKIVSNVLLFYGSSQKISQKFGTKQMFMIYIIGSIVSGLLLYKQQKKNRDQSQFNGSNGGYAALAGFATMFLQNTNIQLFGMVVPYWLKSLISILFCVSQSTNENKNPGLLEFSGFLTGILFYQIKTQILPLQRRTVKQDFLISFN